MSVIQVRSGQAPDVYQEPKEPPSGQRAAHGATWGEGRAMEGSKQGCWIGGMVMPAGGEEARAMAVDLEGPLIWRVFRSRTGEGSGTPRQYSCLENPTGRGAWWAAVHGVAKSRTRPSDFTFMHWRRQWQPTPVLLPGKSHGRRSLVGCSPWGR